MVTVEAVGVGLHMGAEILNTSQYRHDYLVSVGTVETHRTVTSTPNPACCEWPLS